MKQREGKKKKKEKKRKMMINWKTKQKIIQIHS